MSGNNSASLTSEKVVFSTGTKGAARTPVRALSCSTKMAPVTIETANHRMRKGLARRNPSCGSTRGMRTRKQRPARAATDALAA